MIKILPLMLCFSSMVSADLILQSGVRDVIYNGANEMLEKQFLTVTSDDYPDASPETPYFISLYYDKGARFARTLVDLTSDDATINRPIYLAVEALGAVDGNNVPADAVSIVRWVAGEERIWLRIQRSSRTWLLFNGEALPPGEDRRAGFTFGTSARQSAADHDDGLSNLPFNTRDLAGGGIETAVSTMICVDLSQSILATSGIEALLQSWWVIYAADAQVAPGIYQPGTPTNINVNGTFRTGRGFHFGSTLNFLDSKTLFMEQTQDGLQKWRQKLSMELTIEDKGINTLYAHGIVLIDLEVMGVGGFEAEGSFALNLEGENIGLLEVDPTSAVEIAGKVRYTRARLTMGRYVTRGDWMLEAVGDIWLPEGVSERDVSLAYTTSIRRILDPRDVAPFDGPQQCRFCEGSVFPAFEAVNIPLRSNLQQVPHVTRFEGTFETTLTLFNPRPENANYVLTGYDAEGESLGALNGLMGSYSFLKMSADQVLDNPALAGFQFDSEPEIALSVSYRAKGDDKSPAHLSGSQAVGTRFRIDGGNPRLTYDGFSLVNLSDEAISVTVSELPLNGPARSETVLTERLEPRAKLLHSLVPSSGDENAWYRITTSGQAAVTALRGDLQSNYIWEHHAFVLDDGTNLPAADSPRMIPHLTAFEGSFTTHLRLANPTDAAKVTLLEYRDLDGTVLAEMEATLDPGETRDLTQEDFPAREGAASVWVNGSHDVLISAIYRAKDKEAGPAQVPAARQTATSWVLYGGAQALTYDGIAVLNTGNTAVDLSITKLSANGDALEMQVLDEDLPAGAKGLYLPHLVVGYQPGDLLMLTANGPVTVVSLRGDLPSTYVWENRAVPIKE